MNRILIWIRLALGTLAVACLVIAIILWLGQILQAYR